MAAGRRRRRAVAQRLGGMGIVAAAVATAAVLTAVNLAVPGNRGSTAALPPPSPPAPTAPAASPPFTFTFGAYSAAGYRVLAPDQVTSVYQVAGVLHDTKDAKGKVTPTFAGTLTVYQPKMFNPQVARDGTKLTVQGRDAFQVKRPGQALSGDWGAPQYVPADVTALTWQYAPDSWAVLESQGDSFPAADQVKVAELFTGSAGEPVKAKLPFKTGYLPAGFTLQSVSGQSMVADQSGLTSYVYAKSQPSTGPVLGTHDLGHDGTVTSVTITVLWVDTPPPDAVKRKSRCNPGQHWCMSTLPGGEFYIAIEDPSKKLSDAELLRVADGLTFANLKDSSTWYPLP